jgi:hypothetical protein
MGILSDNDEGDKAAEKPGDAKARQLYGQYGSVVAALGVTEEEFYASDLPLNTMAPVPPAPAKK